MKNFLKVASLIVVSQFVFEPLLAQSIQPVTIQLNTLDEFANAGKSWALASDVVMSSFKSATMKPVKGTGILINTTDNAGLLIKNDVGDIELDLDFKNLQGAVSEVLLQGRYGVKLSDSWTRLDPTYADMGGISPLNSSTRSSFDGAAPIMNVAKAPGLWQHLKVKFIAPKFNASGVKIANARFDEIYINGILVQQQADLTGPTQSSMFNDEKITGPLGFKVERGNVAFRNITYRGYAPVVPPQNNRRGFGSRVVNPILVDPGNKSYLLRGFLNYGGKKLTHVISVGSPKQINYSYNLKEGALIQVWRGKFLDVTEMWEQRGEPQLAKPNGSIINLSGAPALASLADLNSVWPDSVAFDDFNNKGYTLDKDKNPTFKYMLAGSEVLDKIAVSASGESLSREITVSNAPANLYCRIAASKKIELMGKGLYAIDGESYYIQVDERLKPSVRKMQNGEELIVNIGKSASPLIYSIIW